MTGQSNLAPLLQAFFTQRLMQQRQASTHTIASYRYVATATAVRPAAVAQGAFGACLGGHRCAVDHGLPR
jgi:hypothetical protein